MKPLSWSSLPTATPTAPHPPNPATLHYPEKVLQFGTGVLLRGLVDFLIDQANRQGQFCGRVVVVKSTKSGDVEAFGRQDQLYTVAIRGLEQGQLITQDWICSSISRVLVADREWAEVLASAAQPSILLVVSNTTEAGIRFEPESIFLTPPTSFPGKLLACLYHRYTVFGGAAEAGWIIIPTELLPDNAQQLRAVVLQLAAYNQLPAPFIQWLEEANTWCNSLVDRIVPGAPNTALATQLHEQWGYHDDLALIAEKYALWAIEGPAAVQKALNFGSAAPELLVVPAIEQFRELKLRLLNGAHTFSCGLAVMLGHRTVAASLQDPVLRQYLTALLLEELAPSLFFLPQSVTAAFSRQVLDRFANPFLEHQWLSISLHYTAKMRWRNVPSLVRYYQHCHQVPRLMAWGFAAYLRFMQGQYHDGQWWGQGAGPPYPIQDPAAERLAQYWQEAPPAELVPRVLADVDLWGEDLQALPGFAAAVETALQAWQDPDPAGKLQALLATSPFAAALAARETNFPRVNND